MIQPASNDLQQLYETDETAWLEAMAELIQLGQHEDLDYAHLGEYLGDMARRDRREVKSRLITLLAHVLNWEHQTDQRPRGWRAMIEQRQELSELAARGVLRNHAEAILAEAYAVERAAAETVIAPDAFPNECAYSLDELLSGNFSAPTDRLSKGSKMPGIDYARNVSSISPRTASRATARTRTVVRPVSFLIEGWYLLHQIRTILQIHERRPRLPRTNPKT